MDSNTIDDIGETITYGTSGFRYDAQLMCNVSEKIGRAIAFLMLRRFFKKVEEKSCLKCLVDSIIKKVRIVGTWGVAITASHNPYTDNGLKLVDQDGLMVETEEERFLESVINNGDIDSVADLLQSEFGIDPVAVPSDLKIDAELLKLCIGKDTRESGPTIQENMVRGIRSILPNINIVDLGYRTTPELHILTIKHYSPGTEQTIYPEFEPNYSQISDVTFYPDSVHPLEAQAYYVRYARYLIRKYKLDLSNVIIDCANGVGAITMEKIVDNISNPPLLINTNYRSLSKLNQESGSDFVESNLERHLINLTDSDIFMGIWEDCGMNHRYLARSNSGRLIDSISPSSSLDNISGMGDTCKSSDISDKLFCSFDGDADRIVFYYLRPNNYRGIHTDINDLQIELMNGDYISMLILKYVVKTIQEDEHFNNHVSTSAKGGEEDKITIGVIHTGYSNGGFMEAVDSVANKVDSNRISISRIMTPVGVKHLITKSHDFDIGIYFEANGHGSVHINNHHGIYELAVLKRLFSQVVGDAIMNMIGVKYILQKLGYSPANFKRLFKVRENATFKIPVEDRSIYLVNDDQTVLLEPKNLARSLSDIIVEHDGVRSFVRPSGTEQILRAYVENDGTNSHNLSNIRNKITKVFTGINKN